jgi:uncharacterized Fe-S cluster protein YjdI
VRKTYVGVKVDVSFDPEVCIHSGKCVRGQPAVFDTSRKPWIAPPWCRPVPCPTPRRLTTSSHRCSAARQAR